MPTVFTIGHSNHPLPRFVELLKQHAIERLADIRRFPGSRAHPHFNREVLQAELSAQGIQYDWIEELGGRRGKIAGGQSSANLGLRNAAFRNYADYMLTAEFTAAMTQFLETAEQQRSALMCAEGLWWRCHRRLVSDWLSARKVSVEHIFPNGSQKPHVLTEGALIEEGRGRVIYPAEPTLFDDDTEALP